VSRDSSGRGQATRTDRRPLFPGAGRGTPGDRQVGDILGDPGAGRTRRELDLSQRPRRLCQGAGDSVAPTGTRSSWRSAAGSPDTPRTRARLASSAGPCWTGRPGSRGGAWRYGTRSPPCPGPGPSPPEEHGADMNMNEPDHGFLRTFVGSGNRASSSPVAVSASRSPGPPSSPGFRRAPRRGMIIAVEPQTGVRTGSGWPGPGTPSWPCPAPGGVSPGGTRGRSRRYKPGRPATPPPPDPRQKAYPAPPR